MASARDRAFLEKCEQFLLHPAVRALSLAQRVDFLEKKGLSPEEITQCLKSVQQHNGLSQLARRSVEELLNKDSGRSAVTAITSGTTATSSPPSRLALLVYAIKRYGAAALLLALLGYGYMQFRRQVSAQLAITQENQRVQRKSRMNSQVEALLAVVKDQQAQYNQAAALLQGRVTRLLTAQETASKQRAESKAKGPVMQFTRNLELQTLQSELLELKSAVVDTFVHPPSSEKKTADASKSKSLVLHVSGTKNATEKTPQTMTSSATASSTSSSDAASQTTNMEALRSGDSSVGSDPIEKRIRPKDLGKTRQQRVKKTKEAPVGTSVASKTQATLSPTEIQELLEASTVNETLSTAGSYRMLFATQ